MKKRTSFVGRSLRTLGLYANADDREAVLSRISQEIGLQISKFY